MILKLIHEQAKQSEALNKCMFISRLFVLLLSSGLFDSFFSSRCQLSDVFISVLLSPHAVRERITESRQSFQVGCSPKIMSEIHIGHEKRC